MIIKQRLVIFVILLFSFVMILQPTTIVYAVEEDELSERDVAVLCGASEDYEENKEQCNQLYDMLEEGEIEDDPDFEYD
jgi:hypothetical protein